MPVTRSPLRDMLAYVWRAAVTTPDWLAYRLRKKLGALRHGRHAGECRFCGENLTWSMGGESPEWCPACGAREPLWPPAPPSF